MLLSSLGTSIAQVGLPALARELTASFQAVQWVVLAYLLATTTLTILIGRLGDLIGRRRLLLVAISLFTAASALCAAAPALGLLIAGRAAQGLGAAGMLSLSVAFVGEMVPPARTGRAMGLLGSMSAIGTALGPSLGGVLISALGWRAVFLVKVPLGALTLLLAHRYLPVTETRAPASPLRLAMLRSSTLSAALALSALVSTVMMATLVVAPFYLSRALGLDPTQVGAAMSAGPLVAALTGVPAGRIVDHFGARPMTTAGLIGLLLGLSLLLVMPTGLLGYVASMVVTTAGYAVFQAANNTALMTNLPSDQRGLVAGMLTLSRNLGLITGASAMAAVFTLGSATSDVTKASPGAVAAGTAVTFAVAAILVVAALAVGANSRRQ